MDLKANPFFLNDEDIEWVNITLDLLTLNEKIGQLFVFNCSILGLKRELKDILKYSPGGVFLTASLASLQRRKANYLQKHTKIPLLIPGDLEMGSFTSIVNGTCFNTNMGVAATNNEDYAYKCGLVSGREGTSVGFNWTFSPVVDINYNHQNPITNTRSYGDTPEIVSKMGCAYIKGVQDSGMAATAKHWPGDGMDDRNQHLSTTINSLGIDEWMKTYGKVYKDVFEAGVKTVMSAWISLPSYDSNEGKSIPGGLSEKLNVVLLRKELGFNGLIVTDAIDMAGINSQGPKDEILPQTIATGCDMILFSSERENDFNRIKNAVETGIISEKRLNNAVMRILALKASLKLHKTKGIPNKKDKKRYVGSKEHKEWSNESIKSSITLVKDTQNLLPLTPEKYNKILLVIRGRNLFFLRKFKSMLSKKGFKVKKYKSGINKIYKNYDLIIFLINEMLWYTSTTLRLTHLLRDAGMMRSVHNEVPCLFISLGNPYHLYEIPTMKTLINCYNPFKRTQKILIEMLLGNIPFMGISPVDVFCGLEDAKP